MKSYIHSLGRAAFAFFPMVILLGTAFMAFLFPLSADACSCSPKPPVDEAFERSDAVFYGRCYSFTLHPKSHRTALIKVYRSFKGDFKKEDFVEVNTATEGGLCGFGFIAGEYYIIYAGKYEGEYHTDICKRTTYAPGYYPGREYLIETHKEYSALADLERKLHDSAEQTSDGNAEKPTGDEREP